MADDARPYVSIDPAMRSGQPTLHNTRLTVEAVTDLVWDGVPVDQVAHDYDITRPDVLVVCWYQGTYGDRTWRKRWVDWADEVAGALWSSRYDLATTAATALAALERLRATPPTADKPAAGFRLDQERRTTPTVQPTAQQPYWRGRPPAPATAHTEEQP